MDSSFDYFDVDDRRIFKALDWLVSLNVATGRHPMRNACEVEVVNWNCSFHMYEWTFSVHKSLVKAICDGAIRRLKAPLWDVVCRGVMPLKDDNAPRQMSLTNQRYPESSESSESYESSEGARSSENPQSSESSRLTRSHPQRMYSLTIILRGSIGDKRSVQADTEALLGSVALVHTQRVLDADRYWWRIAHDALHERFQQDLFSLLFADALDSCTKACNLLCPYAT